MRREGGREGRIVVFVPAFVDRSVDNLIKRIK
jgi:hypothetical protein